MKKIAFVLVSAFLTALAFFANSTQNVFAKVSNNGQLQIEQQIKQQLEQQSLVLEQSVDNDGLLARHYSHSSHGSHGSHASHSSHTSHFSGR